MIMFNGCSVHSVTLDGVNEIIPPRGTELEDY